MWASRHCASPKDDTLCTQQTSPQMLLLPHTCIQHACSAGHAKRVLSRSTPEGLGCCSHHCQLHGHPLQHSREGDFRDDSASPRQTGNGSCSHTCSKFPLLPPSPTEQSRAGEMDRHVISLQVDLHSTHMLYFRLMRPPVHWLQQCPTLQACFLPCTVVGVGQELQKIIIKDSPSCCLLLFLLCAGSGIHSCSQPKTRLVSMCMVLSTKSSQNAFHGGCSCTPIVTR